MKIRKLLSIISVLFVFGQMAAFAEEKTLDYSNAAVSIKYYNRSIYYPGNADEAPVFVHITIKNNGAETLRFKLADDRMFSADFNAYNVKNIGLDQTDEIIRKRTITEDGKDKEVEEDVPGDELIVKKIKYGKEPKAKILRKQNLHAIHILLIICHICFLSLSLCTYICTLYIYLYIHVYLSIYVGIDGIYQIGRWVYMCLCMCVCIYTYLCVHR